MNAKQGCWTCKQRKIRCDKALPHCDNCLRTNRECQGYGIRLVWPDSPDGRRSKADVFAASSSDDERQLTSWNGHVQFLNFTLGDLRNRKLFRPAARKCLSSPQPALTLHPVVGQDALLLSYYESNIATMISTTNAQNGFRNDLLPMALATPPDPAASALCNAMLAVAAHHTLGSAAALPYKARAVSHLSRALGAGSEEATEIQMAASMMLCVYSVFDEAEGNWNVHLDGTKRMFRRKKRVDSEFVLTWFLYHEVLGCFTRPSRLQDDETDMLSYVEASIQDPTLIIGSLGCSLETISIIHKINKMRLHHSTPKTATPTTTALTHPSPKASKQRLLLETQLANLTQILPPLERHNHLRTLAIAELYRLAAILYLQRICPSTPDDAPRRALYLKKAFELFSLLQVATSPWPVFVVACESAPSDEDRMAILGVLDRMDEVRGIGNVRVMRGLVESFWKQFDLGQVAEGAWASWWDDDGDAAVAEPWFI